MNDFDCMREEPRRNQNMRDDYHQSKRIVLLMLVLALVSAANSVFAQGTAFTYQGRLQDGGTNANGSYDLQFTLWDSLSGGTQQPQPTPVTVTKSNVVVSNGVFTTQLDFGSAAFSGADRFLETSVKLSGAASFTLLTPRQPITSTPYALRSASSSSADVAATAANATQLGGVAANQYVITTDSRLTDPRTPTAGSSNYIQNTTTQQGSSNFNISGDGIVGSTLSGNIVNATTQFNLGGARAFAVTGAAAFPTGNTFAGVDSGTANSVQNGGVLNTFFGGGSGRLNSSGAENSFFGTLTGRSNTTGTGNSYFGDLAGASNTTGPNGSFFGSGAGFSNTVGSYNSFFGQQSGNSNTNGSANSFFGAGAGLHNTTASNNSFFGISAGYSNTTGTVNSFFGSNAGGSNTTGQANSFFGSSAGGFNTTASNNSFFGYGAGGSNTTGGANSFFGVVAGGNNTTGSNNSFFGLDAGLFNTSGLNNTFIGYRAGNPDTSTQVNNSIAIGTLATVSTDNTIVLGTGTATTQIPGALRVSGSGSIGGNFGIGTTTPGATLDVRNNSGSAFINLLSGSGSASLSLTRSAAVASQSAQIGFYSGGTVDFAMGTSQGSAGNSDFSIYDYGINDNAFTIVKSTGNVGIGTTSPGYRFHVNGTTPSAFAAHIQTSGLASGSSYGLVVSAGTNVNDMSFQARNQAGTSLFAVRGDGQAAFNGYVNIFGPTSLFGTLYLQNLSGGGSQSLCTPPGGGSVGQCSSSLRYKTNLANFHAGMEIINRLNPLTFDWKRDGTHDLGLGAEDVEKVNPLLVTYNKDGQVEGVKYDRIGVVLVNAVKEQQTQIESQQEQLKRQQEQIKFQEDQAKQQRAAFAAQQQELKSLKNLVCRSHRRAKVCK